jgi:hypothetical protein
LGGRARSPVVGSPISNPLIKPAGSVPGRPLAGRCQEAQTFL